MGAGIIVELQRKKQEYINRIFENQNKIREFERTHESLRVFKLAVEKSHEEFYGIHLAQQKILSEVEALKQNSRTAREYSDGMQDLFSGVGSRIACGVYVVLLERIMARLKKYTDSIFECESDIAYCERKIRDIDLRIGETRRKEELEQVILDGGM